jgi:hypothetical protein
MSHEDPRPGRTYCTAVEDYDCLAPAGISTGAGAAGVPGVLRKDLFICGYCGEPVCLKCSTEFGDLGRSCDNHKPEELMDWLRLMARLKPPKKRKASA